MTSRDDDRRRALGLPTVAEEEAGKLKKLQEAEAWRQGEPARLEMKRKFQSVIQPWIVAEFEACKALAPRRGVTIDPVQVMNMVPDILADVQYLLRRNTAPRAPISPLGTLQFLLKADGKVYGGLAKSGVPILENATGILLDNFTQQHVGQFFDLLLAEAKR